MPGSINMLVGARVMMAAADLHSPSVADLAQEVKGPAKRGSEGDTAGRLA
jgi:hypothetical protein